MKLDMHLHSNYSPDGKASPRDILKQARKIGLGGVCITDHNTLRGNAEARKIAPEFGLTVVRGMEISSSGGHILAYGIDEEIPMGLGPRETVDRIRENGGMAVIPHPFRYWSGLGDSVTREIAPDAIEVLNAHSTGKDNRMARELCLAMNLPMTAGSDAHEVRGLGRAGVSVPDAVDEDAVLKAIRSGRARVSGQDRGPGGALKDRILTVTQWMGRGFKKM